MKDQIIQTLDKQNTPNNPSAQLQFNAAYRAAIAISHRNLKAGVDTNASDHALKTLGLLPTSTAKYAHLTAGFFSTTPRDPNDAIGLNGLLDFTTIGV